MTLNTHLRSGFLLLLAFCFAIPANAQAPDLTNGESRTDELFWNLGPTGMRGWFYHEGNSTDLARQIEVMAVDATVGSPASGFLDVGDVILGADGTGAQPVAFTSDARKAFAHAIADAEANNPATLKILRWRAGVTETASITLENLGAYSATAPYNCPKSAAILEKGLDAVMAGGANDNYNLSLLALLAGNDTGNPDNAARQARAKTEAYELVLTEEQIAEYTSDEVLRYSKVAWTIGFKMVALAEYYLHTGDAGEDPLRGNTEVYDSLRAYAIAYANGQSMFGTGGHQFSLTSNGPYGIGYGVVNSANMQCFYGLLLVREAGINDQKILDAIERSSRFYGSYVDRGSIPYGEHSPGGGYESNGKMGIAGLIFRLHGSRDYEAEYYAKMATASAINRDGGHTGPYFNYLWAPLGANAGGPEALAAFFAEQSWHYDLSRNWDGSYTFDTYGQGSSNSGTPKWSGNFQMYLTALLTYAAPLRETYTTGKVFDPGTPLLDTADVDEAELAIDLAQDNGWSSRTTPELLADLGSGLPPFRNEVAAEIGNRTAEHATLLPTLESMALGTGGETLHQRMGACRALGYIKDDASLPLLVGLLNDPLDRVRYAAARELYSFSIEARLAQVDLLMAACAETSKPLLPLDEEDPLHLTNSHLVEALFHPGGGGSRGCLYGSDLVGIDRDLLYPAIRAALLNPRGAVRSMPHIVYPSLSREDVEAIADGLVDSTMFESPADRMFAASVRNKGLDLMQSHNFAEGVPLAKIVTNERKEKEGLDPLLAYAAESLLVKPDPEIIDWLNVLIANDTLTTVSNWPDSGTTNYPQLVLDAIAADSSPEVPTPFKRIYSIYKDDDSLTLPEDRTVLRVAAYDYAQGDSVYTWRKVHGVGEVIFTPNGTTDAVDTTVILDGTPGEYLFEVTMSDSRGLTEVTETVALTLYAVGGTLPTNNPPTADPQSVTVEQGTPTQIILTGSDPEGNALTYSVTSGPGNGTLSGTAPNLVYTATANYSGSDSITFEVMDSEGQVDSATVSITVNALGSPVGLAIYEPFDYPVHPAVLDGASGSSEIGLDGTWTAGNDIYTEGPGYTYGTLPTTGPRLWSRGFGNPGASRPIDPAALAGSGLLDDGATLWFSVLIGCDDTWTREIQIALANASFPYRHYILDDGAEPGTGLGLHFSDKEFRAAQFFDASQGTSSDAMLVGDWDTDVAGRMNRYGDLRLVVVKITWGASSDTVEVYLPFEDMLLPAEPSSTLVANVDQSKFDVLTFSRGGDLWIDEIRFGGTLQSVLQGTAVQSSPIDSSAPAPDPMTFEVAPQASSSSSISMTATAAYDPLGVEYYFTCTAGGGSDSGWQESNHYTDTGLTPGVAYSYTVKARDKHPGLNETAASSAASATIPAQGTVPGVGGLLQATAEAMITDAGMSVGSVTTASSYSLTVPAGHVLSQNPAGATSTAYGTSVDLEISIGQDPALPVLTPVNIDDDHGDAAVVLPAMITYTLTFSQDMDLSTFDAGDFENLGDFPILIGAISEPSPGVVTVEVTPDTLDGGYLHFAIAKGAIIEDANGNDLNTSLPIADEDIIAILRPANYLPVVGAGSDQTITTTTPRPWTPLLISTAAWYDAADTGSITHSGGAVSQWSDKSGNGNHATQTNASIRPVTGTRTTNSLNVLDFNFVNNQSMNIPSIDLIGKESWAVILLDDPTTTTNQLIMGGGNNTQVGISPSNGQMRFWRGSNPYTSDSQSTASVPVNTPALVGWLGHTSTKKFSINGVLEDTGDSYKAGGTLDVTNLGRGQYKSMDGTIGELVITNTLSTADRETTEGYLAHKWGLTGNLPAVHPYKTAAPVQEVWDVALDGTVSDLDEDALATTWSVLSGPGNVEFADSGAVDTTATFFVTGDYVLELVADDGTAQGSDQLTITIVNLADSTAPTLASSDIVDDRGGASALEGDTVTYTLTFSEDIYESIVDASDFSNAGTATVTIDSVNESSPGVFTVVVTATNAGTLQLQVDQGALITDLGGNPLDTSSAIADDTTITIEEPNVAPVWTSNPIDESDATEDVAYNSTLADDASDANAGDTLTFLKVSGPAWLSVAANGSLSGTPPDGEVGEDFFTVSVSDGIAPAVEATLNITVTGTPHFEAWIGGFNLDPADQDFMDDPDGDQQGNGLEAWFGTHPGQHNSGLVFLSTDGSTCTFSHPKNDNPPSGLTGFYEWSPNLTDWYGSESGPTGGPNLTISANTVGTTTTVTITGSGTLDYFFVRASVQRD